MLFLQAEYLTVIMVRVLGGWYCFFISIILILNTTIMEDANKNYPQREQNQSQDFASDSAAQGTTGGPNSWNEQTQVVNEQDQNRAVNTGDEEYKENVTGRTEEPTPRDLNLSDADKAASDSPGGAEIETPHRLEGDDETSTERKIPKM
jgi:hypothetical protein